MEVIAPTIAMLGFLGVIGWIVSIVVEGRKRTMAIRARADFQNRVLEKYGSGREFVELVQSEGGQKLLNALPAEPAAGPADRILGSVHRGILLIFLGIGLLIVPAFVERGDIERLSLAFGVILLALGIGFLVSAVLSRRLARSLGLFPPAELPGSRELASRS
jgi:hypothetical protein